MGTWDKTITGPHSHFWAPSRQGILSAITGLSSFLPLLIAVDFCNTEALTSVLSNSWLGTVNLMVLKSRYQSLSHDTLADGNNQITRAHFGINNRKCSLFGTSFTWLFPPLWSHSESNGSQPPDPTRWHLRGMCLWLDPVLIFRFETKTKLLVLVQLVPRIVY